MKHLSFPINETQNQIATDKARNEWGLQKSNILLKKTNLNGSGFGRYKNWNIGCERILLFSVSGLISFGSLGNLREKGRIRGARRSLSGLKRRGLEGGWAKLEAESSIYLNVVVFFPREYFLSSPLPGLCGEMKGLFRHFPKRSPPSEPKEINPDTENKRIPSQPLYLPNPSLHWYGFQGSYYDFFRLFSLFYYLGSSFFSPIGCSDVLLLPPDAHVGEIYPTYLSFCLILLHSARTTRILSALSCFLSEHSTNTWSS
uniref:Uncharacterized protein n=1 Tax=Cucumis melo TaxID=3656 RepID=A0A9I9EBR5_CUCME